MYYVLVGIIVAMDMYLPKSMSIIVAVSSMYITWCSLRCSCGGVYVDMCLPIGTHHYMFIVDGVWKHDPDNTLVSI